MDYTFDVAGVTGGSGCSTELAGKANGTFIVKEGFVGDWRSAAFISCQQVHGNKYQWKMGAAIVGQVDRISLQLSLTKVGVNLVTYKHDFPLPHDRTQPFTLKRSFASPLCSGFPDEITIRPV